MRLTKTQKKPSRFGITMILKFVGGILLGILIILAAIFAPISKPDPRIFQPDEVKFLTTDGDTAVITNTGHVDIYVHKRK